MLVQATKYFEIVLDSLETLYNEDKIGARDFRRILAYVMSFKDLSPGAIKMIQERYKTVLPIEIMLSREGEREKYLSDSGTFLKNYKLLIKNGQLPLSCRFAYSE